MTEPTPALVARDIHKRFGAIEVLKGVSVTAHQGEVIAMLGASGSGKSTFLRCLNLLERPDSGQIIVAGEALELRPGRTGSLEAVHPRQLEQMRTRLGMVFQQFNLWAHMTALQNVIEAPVHVLGMPRAMAVERGRALLEKVGLAERADYYPAHLSGGQQQRVAIARALAMDPAVLLFDEPTSALDPELVGEVLRVMRDLALEGRTMVVVTHEMSFARDVASHVVFLHQGVLEEEGPPAELFNAPASPRLQQFLERFRAG